MFDDKFHMITIVKVDKNIKLYIDANNVADTEFKPKNISKQLQLGYYK